MDNNIKAVEIIYVDGADIVYEERTVKGTRKLVAMAKSFYYGNEYIELDYHKYLETYKLYTLKRYAPLTDIHGMTIAGWEQCLVADTPIANYVVFDKPQISKLIKQASR